MICKNCNWAFMGPHHKYCAICGHPVDNKLISEFLNDIKYRWNKIIEKLTEISENLGLKAEFYFPINDNFGELQEKWEQRSKE